MAQQTNVLGTPLEICSADPLTGFLRNGKCGHHPSDRGLHYVCVRVTQTFLDFSKAKGNDLSTPIPAYNFPGLRPGNQWCVCALRWKEAYFAGIAPPVILESTNSNVLNLISIEELISYAVPKNGRQTNVPRDN